MSQDVKFYKAVQIEQESEYDKRLIATYLKIKGNIRKHNALRKKLIHKLKTFIKYPSLNSMKYFIVTNSIYQCFATSLGACLLDNYWSKSNDTIEIMIASLIGSIICSPSIYICLNYFLYECNKSRKMPIFNRINRYIRPIFQIIFECFTGIIAYEYINSGTIDPQRLISCSYLGSFALFLPTHIMIKSLTLAVDSLEIDNSISIPLEENFINAQEKIIFDEAKISLDKIHEAKISTHKIEEDVIPTARVYEATLIT